MRSLLILAVIIFIALPGCKKSTENSYYIAGTFKGYYVRNNTDTADITIQFNDGNFSGTSSKNYPIIASGSFQQTGTWLQFFNVSSMASIDVLSGEFAYYCEGNKLSFWKATTTASAFYKLSKQ